MFLTSKNLNVGFPLPHSIRWWPRKRSDTTVMFSQNGRRSPSLDTNGQGAEYVNTLPETSTLPRTRSQDTDPRCPTALRVPDERPRLEGSWPTCQARWSDDEESDAGRCSSLPSRVEVVWSRPKEVLLRPDAASGGYTPLPRPDRRSSGSASGSVAKSSTAEEEESLCFVNTVYMTIPDPTATLNNHLPPDPHRGALPPPPSGILPSSEILSG